MPQKEVEWVPGYKSKKNRNRKNIKIEKKSKFRIVNTKNWNKLKIEKNEKKNLTQKISRFKKLSLIKNFRKSVKKIEK